MQLSLLIVLCFAAVQHANACNPVVSGFFNPDSLRYQNVDWRPTEAPRRSIELEAAVFKATPSAPLEATFSATVGGSGPWNATATLTLFASSGCQSSTIVEQRHAATEGGAHHVSIRLTSHTDVACSSRYYVSAVVSWNDVPRKIALALDESDCFVRNVCCASSGVCDSSPHSTCASRDHCIDAGNSINTTVTCPNSDNVCCVLSAAIPPPPPETPSPSTVDIEADEDDSVNASALLAYILLSATGIAGMAFLYYFYWSRKKQLHDENGLEMITM